MKVSKMKVVSIIGSLGLTASVLTGCSSTPTSNKEYMKVVDSNGKTRYIDKDDYDRDKNHSMFIPYNSWNGSNHTGLKSSSSFKGKVYTSKPSIPTSTKSSSGVGKSFSGKSGGFGG